MTVSSTQSRKDYAGDGATTQFTVPYFFIENADIVATLRSTGGAETTWTEGTEYTLTGAGVPSGGTLTAVSTGTDFTPQSGETLVIKRKEQFTQPSDFAVAGALPSETIEEGYDRAVMLAQQLSEDLGRTPRLADTSPTTSVLVIPEPEADKVLAWNSTGDNLTNGPTTGQITQASTKADQAAASATAAANSASAAATSETNAAASEANAVNAAGFKFTFDTSTTMADPGVGDLRFNNATVSSVTALALDATSADTGNPDVSDFIAAWDDSTNTALRGTIIIRKVGAPSTFAIFNVTGAVTDNTGWLQVTVTHVTSGGTFSAADNLIVHFTRTGDQPATDLVTDLTPQLGAALDTNSFAIDESEGSAVASAATADIWSTTGNTVHVTGTTTITNFGTAPRAGAWRKVIFDDILTLTDGANLNLPGSANITTAADDFAFVYAETTTLFKVLYFKADGTPIAGGGADVQSFTASGTWTKPGSGTYAFVETWGAGASGGKTQAGSASGGGGGGGYKAAWFLLTALGATETVTIGAGGASITAGNTSGNVGGNTTFGSLLTAYGGGGGRGAAGEFGGGGGGGGGISAGATGSSATGATGGGPLGGAANGDNSGFGGGGGASGTGTPAIAGQSAFGGGGGGGGGATTNVGGGNSIFAGGGGGGGRTTSGAGDGGTSEQGGDGGAGALNAANATAGTQPSGGGGGSESGNSGAGAAGQCRVTVV